MSVQDLGVKFKCYFWFAGKLDLQLTCSSVQKPLLLNASMFDFLLVLLITVNSKGGKHQFLAELKCSLAWVA